MRSFCATLYIYIYIYVYMSSNEGPELSEHNYFVSREPSASVQQYFLIPYGNKLVDIRT